MEEELRIWKSEPRAWVLTLLLTFCVTWGKPLPSEPHVQKWNDHLCPASLTSVTVMMSVLHCKVPPESYQNTAVQGVTHLKVTQLWSGRTKVQTGRHWSLWCVCVCVHTRACVCVCVVSLQEFYKGSNEIINEKRSCRLQNATAMWVTPGLSLGFHVTSTCGIQDWVDKGLTEVCPSVMLPMETIKTLSHIQTNNFCAFGEICQSSVTPLKPIPWTSIPRSAGLNLGVAILMQLQTYFTFLKSPNKINKNQNPILLH